MRQASKRIPDSAEKTVRDIRRATRRHHSAEEKIRIVLEGLRGEDSIAELCRREGIVQKEFALGATEQGVVAASSLFGILIGASALGGLADRYGRKQLFIVEMVLFCIFTAVLALSPSYAGAVAALVGVGVALGCDYPTAHLIISESIPSRIRGRMVLAAFGFQAVGGLAGTAVGFLILFENA